MLGSSCVRLSGYICVSACYVCLCDDVQLYILWRSSVRSDYTPGPSSVPTDVAEDEEGHISLDTKNIGRA